MNRPNPNVVRATRCVSALLALLVLGGCFEIEESSMVPVAIAGSDQSYPDDDSVTVDLSGSESSDPDGRIVDYQWRYTGDPRGEDVPEPEGDAGMPMLDPLEALGYAPRPEFCPEPPGPEEAPWIMVPERWCELEPTGKADISVDLTTGVYRFTLWVTDDDGNIAADSVVVHVGDTPPYREPHE